MYIKTQDLPRILIQMLARRSFFKKDIMVTPSITCSMLCPGGAGLRYYVTIVDLSTDEVLLDNFGSWGGSNMFNPQNPVDLNDKEYTLAPGIVVIKGCVGYYAHAEIFVHPDTIAKLVPEKSMEMTPWEQKALRVIATCTRGRALEFHYHGLGGYDTKRPEFVGLVQKGLITINKRGAVAITTAGKNALEY